MGSWLGEGSRIANASRQWLAPEDTATNIAKDHPFIIALAIGNDTHLGDTDTFKVQWRVSGGSWADLGVTGAMKQSSATDLVNGNDVTAAEAGCTSALAFEQEAGELEGANTTPSITISQDGWFEVQCAVDPADATPESVYEFQIRIVGDGKDLGVGSATVTVKAIDIGTAAIARPDATSSNYTHILKENPANATGTITSIEVWVAVECSALDVGTYVSDGGTNFHTRDSEALGVVVSGSKQTFSGLDMDVTTGDYLGFHTPVGTLERTDTVGEGYWYLSGDYCPTTEVTFLDGTGTTRTISLYGTGTEAAAVQELIASPVGVVSSVQQAGIAGSGIAPLAGATIAVASSVQVAGIAGTGNAPLVASPVAVASSIQQAALTAEGIAPLASSPVASVSSVQNSAIAGIGDAPLAAAFVQVVSSVVTGVVENVSAEQELTASPITVASSVQSASIAGSGTAPLASSPVAAVSSVQQPALTAEGEAPLAASPIAVVASVLTAAIITSIQYLVASSVSVVSSIRQATIFGSGEASLVASPISVASSVITGTIENVSAEQELTASPIAMASSVRQASIAGVLVTLVASPISISATVRSTTLAGVGTAILASAPIQVTSSIMAAVVSGSGVASLASSPISVSASVQTAIAILVWIATASGSGIGSGATEALLEIIAGALGHGVGEGDVPGVLLVHRGVRRAPIIHNLGRVKPTPHDLGDSLREYTLGRRR